MDKVLIMRTLTINSVKRSGVVCLLQNRRGYLTDRQVCVCELALRSDLDRKTLLNNVFIITIQNYIKAHLTLSY